MALDRRARHEEAGAAYAKEEEAEEEEGEGEKDKCALAQGEKITAVPTRVLLLLQDSCWKHRRHYHSGHADPNRATKPRREAGAHAKGVDGSSKKYIFTHT